MTRIVPVDNDTGSGLEPPPKVVFDHCGFRFEAAATSCLFVINVELMLFLMSFVEFLAVMDFLVFFIEATDLEKKENRAHCFNNFPFFMLEEP